MFKPIHGPKEGRSHPGLLYSGPSHSSVKQSWIRRLTYVLIWAVCLVVLWSFLHSRNGADSSLPASARAPIPAPISEHKLSGDAILNNKEPLILADSAGYEEHNMKPLNDVHKHIPDESPNHPQKPPVVNPLPEILTKPVAKVDQESAYVHASGSDKKTSQSKLGSPGSTPVSDNWSDRSQFKQTLTHVISLLPDEMYMRELVRPVEGSGKSRMREMGLRTRAYTTYFNAWEALHTATDADGTSYVRDDLVAYLQTHRDSLGFDDLPTVIHQYETYRAFLQKFGDLLFPWTKPYYSDHMTFHQSFEQGGRGLVLTAGDNQAPFLLTTIWSFRKLGCNLPVEVMYLGDEDLGEDYRALLEAIPGVVTRDLSAMVDDSGWQLRGWAGKPFAMLYSSFREVIFIDADSLFFQNPEVLFEDPDYQRTGALFFKDRLMSPENKRRWLQQVLPKPIPKAAKETRLWTGESGHMQESGVVVVDKWRHFMAMLLITRFNGPDRDGDAANGITGVYDMMYGDKETFWIGFLLAGDESFAFHRGSAGVMGTVAPPGEKPPSFDKPNEDHESETGPDTNPEKPAGIESVDHEPTTYKVCASQLIHIGTDNRPLWFNGWLLEDKYAEHAEKKFRKFETYLREPNELKEPQAWELGASNICCLTVPPEDKFDFSEEEKQFLQMIIHKATEVGLEGLSYR